MRVRRGGHARRRQRTAWRTLACAALALVAVAACAGPAELAIPRPGGMAVPTAPPSTPVPVTVPPATKPSPTAGNGSAVGGCIADLWKRIKDHIADGSVALVGLVDECRGARIETTLDPGDVPGAVRICARAAEVAWANGVETITVVDGDGTTIAVGTEGSTCVGAP